MFFPEGVFPKLEIFIIFSQIKSEELGVNKIPFFPKLKKNPDHPEENYQFSPTFWELFFETYSIMFQSHSKVI